MNGLLITHRGAQKVPKEALYKIAPPTGTSTWKPIAHSEFVDSLTTTLHAQGLVVRKEEYAVQRDGKLLFGVLDLAWQETQEFAAALGLRTSNDKSFAIQIAVGVRVMVCDNLAFSGDLIALKRKHTAGLNLPVELVSAIERYVHNFDILKRGITQLKKTSVSLRTARALVFSVFARRIVPLRLFHYVAPAYAKDVTRDNGITLWDVHNCFTQALQRLSPCLSFEANIQLGKFFQLTEQRQTLPVSVSLPVLDGAAHAA